MAFQRSHTSAFSTGVPVTVALPISAPLPRCDRTWATSQSAHIDGCTRSSADAPATNVTRRSWAPRSAAIQTRASCSIMLRVRFGAPQRRPPGHDQTGSAIGSVPRSNDDHLIAQRDASALPWSSRNAAPSAAYLSDRPELRPACDRRRRGEAELSLNAGSATFAIVTERHLGDATASQAGGRYGIASSSLGAMMTRK